MNLHKLQKRYLCRAASTLAAVFLLTALAVAGDDGRSLFVLTSTNNPSGNDVVVFKLDTAGTPSLSWWTSCRPVVRAAPARTREFSSSRVTSEPWLTTDPIASANWCGMTIPLASGERFISHLSA